MLTTPNPSPAAVGDSASPFDSPSFVSEIGLLTKHPEHFTSTYLWYASVFAQIASRVLILIAEYSAPGDLRDFSVAHINPSFEKAFAIQKEQVQGRPFSAVFPRESNCWFETLRHTIEAGVKCRLSDQTLSSHEITFMPAPGNAVVVVIEDDVRVLRNSEAEIRHAQKLALVGQIAGGAAHDLNNILTSIMLLVQYTADQPGIPAAILPPMRDIQRYVDQASRLTQQLLGFSRFDDVRMMQRDLRAIVDDTVRLARRVFPESIAISSESTPTPLNVMADEGMMHQVLLNLCVNARDAMPNGGQLKITLSTVARGRGDASSCSTRMHCIAVADTGNGISKQNLARLFEPFFTTKPRGKGTGLGLATAARILEQHGGAIEVSSTEGQGTEFRVLLPAFPV